MPKNPPRSRPPSAALADDEDSPPPEDSRSPKAETDAIVLLSNLCVVIGGEGASFDLASTMKPPLVHHPPARLATDLPELPGAMAVSDFLSPFFVNLESRSCWAEVGHRAAKLGCQIGTPRSASAMKHQVLASEEFLDTKGNALRRDTSLLGQVSPKRGTPSAFS